MISQLLSVTAALIVTGAFAGTIHYVADSSTDFDGPRDVTLYLYTQGNPIEAEIITLDDDSTSPSFNPAHPTRVVIHGAKSQAEHLFGFRETYIATDDEYNIIMVDWSGPAAQDYDEGMKSGVKVGHYVGDVLKHLIEARSLDPDTLTIIGHSMGAHVAGIAGYRVGGDIVSEVVALDPAANIFDSNPLEDKLDASDAKFVQVIHTNGGNWGALESRGTVDFFPNGGSFQDACPAHGHDELCDHIIVVDYYLESIASNDLVGLWCPNYNDFINGRCSGNGVAVMGEWTPHSISGNYYLETTASSPYGKGKPSSSSSVSINLGLLLFVSIVFYLPNFCLQLRL